VQMGGVALDDGGRAALGLDGRGARPHTTYAFDFLYSSNAARNRSMSCFDR
jgi:hypothetical protein